MKVSWKGRERKTIITYLNRVEEDKVMEFLKEKLNRKRLFVKRGWMNGDYETKEDGRKDLMREEDERI